VWLIKKFSGVKAVVTQEDSMAEWKMVDADGHIREIESDVFEYLPEHYKGRRDAVLYFPLLPHHGWHRQAGSGGMGASFLVPTLEDWQEALDQATSRRRRFIPRASCTSARWVWSISLSI
jgi:hypothetical protein